jgi:hypothetical protein
MPSADDQRYSLLRLTSMPDHKLFPAALFGFPRGVPMTWEQDADAVLVTAEVGGEKIMTTMRHEWIVDESKTVQFETALRLFRRSVSAATQRAGGKDPVSGTPSSR